jgi:cytochrome c oxidase subunit 2
MSHGSPSRSPRPAHPTTPARRARVLALVMPLVLLAASCASNAPQDTLEPKGPIARSIDQLWDGVFLVAVVVFIVVEFGTLYLVMRFRRRKDDNDDELPTQTHGNNRLEIAWTIVPAVMLAVVGFFTLVTLFDINQRDDEDLTVKVVGQQWWWEYEYDVDGDGEFTEEVLTANDLVIPAGVDVNLQLESNDVIHSYWVPALNGKKDVVPGRTHDLVLNADDPGVYLGQCTEFCGLSHSLMQNRVVALPQAEFDAWLAAQTEDATMPADGTDAAAGAESFATQCSGCHLARGINDEEFEEAGSGEELLVSGNAPDLTHFASRGTFAGAIFDLWLDQDDNGTVDPDEVGGELNRADLEAWLRNPPGEKPMDAPHVPEEGDAPVRGMPNFNLQEAQIDELVAFLETLD